MAKIQYVVFLLILALFNKLEARSHYEANKYWYDKLQHLESRRENNRFLGTQNEDFIQEVIGWPESGILNGIKQVAGVAVDKFGNVHIFHRGNRQWNELSFDFNNNYLQKNIGPIPIDTIFVLNQHSGKVMRSWGKKKFYLPHGITIDSNGNSWVTDVALHQIMKFPDGDDLPSLVLGREFEHGSDDEHFCKPTDVAVLSSGYFFVSDGYCNSRVMMFKPDGTFHKKIGVEDRMIVPHGLSLMEERSMLCVADRENARILCYPLDLARNDTAAVATVTFNIFLGAVYAIDHKDNFLFAVTGPKSQSSDAHGLTIDLNNKRMINVWNSHWGFLMPHDISVSPDGGCLYVADAAVEASRKISKFHLLN